MVEIYYLRGILLNVQFTIYIQSLAGISVKFFAVSRQWKVSFNDTNPYIEPESWDNEPGDYSTVTSELPYLRPVLVIVYFSLNQMWEFQGLGPNSNWSVKCYSEFKK